jgi:hypothetical protein
MSHSKKVGSKFIILYILYCVVVIVTCELLEKKESSHELDHHYNISYALINIL